MLRPDGRPSCPGRPADRALRTGHPPASLPVERRLPRHQPAADGPPFPAQHWPGATTQASGRPRPTAGAGGELSPAPEPRRRRRPALRGAPGDGDHRLDQFPPGLDDLKADCIICPSQAAYDLCRRRGVPADRLVRAGLPIHPRFQDGIRHAGDKPSMRLRLRLRPHAPTVLLAGGGDGTEPLRKYAAALARPPLAVQALAACGRNQTLARRTREDNHAGGHVFGCAENMPDLLLAADLLATRARPGLIAVGLSCGCPLLLTGYLPGQEG